MTIATVTSKGQVTIPKSIRDALRLHTGDKLEFIVTEEGDTLLRPVTKKVDDVFGRQLGTQGLDHGQSADTGIEYADR